MSTNGLPSLREVNRVASAPSSQQSIPEGQSTDASSHPSPCDSQSLKEEGPDAALQQQPAIAGCLTKLYALLERPANHHIIRWDPIEEHIIVECLEQLAFHVFPSVTRQSRFASFTRQLNIYGFMGKVNLGNVDPAIDDPDASTWSHPTLNVQPSLAA
uniref:SKN7 n=1 Tax=Ganoderma boninense TaxID=34458 RepID=A0A5K1JXJ8_9APHY|nr:SKN7 [Ganoderma boninense]